MFGALINKDKGFFEMFEKSASNLVAGAQALAGMMEAYPAGLASWVKIIKDTEHQGDVITHQTIEMLNKTFVTPIDREDIHELITKLDDILDLMDGASGRLALYKIDAITDEAKSFAGLLVKATGIIVRAVACLRRLNKCPEMNSYFVEIHTIENEGDQLLRRAMVNLFAGADPINLIKWKEVYQDLETATDRCEDVANAIEGIAMKYA